MTVVVDVLFRHIHRFENIRYLIVEVIVFRKVKKAESVNLKE